MGNHRECFRQVTRINGTSMGQTDDVSVNEEEQTSLAS